MNRAEQINDILSRLVRETPEVEQASVLSGDGLSIAAFPADAESDDRTAALVAAFFRMGEHTSGELGRGSTEQMQIRGNHGWLLLIPIVPDAILQMRAYPRAKLGALQMNMRQAVADLRGLF